MPISAMRTTAQSPALERIVCGAIAFAIAAVLVLASRLTPASEGFGTHRQLGLKDCAWVMWFKKPCMTCGMTTSFAHAADGHLVKGFLTQPAGLLLSVACATVFWICLHSALTGSLVARASLRAIRGSTILLASATFLLAWWYKYLTWPNS